jgi:hypothetical protein
MREIMREELLENNYEKIVMIEDLLEKIYWRRVMREEEL